MTVAIEIRELQEIQLRGGVLIDCINGPNYEIMQIGRYLIRELNMDQIAAIECDLFPSISSILGGKPSFPMRVYANQSMKISVIVSDFQPNPVCERSLGKSLINWVKSRSMALVITSFQLPSTEPVIDLGAVCSTNTARLRLEQSRIDPVDNIRISGLPAILLNEGFWVNMDVISLVFQPFSFGRQKTSIGERIVQGIDVLLPEAKFDVRRLVPFGSSAFSSESDQRASSNQQESSN